MKEKKNDIPAIVAALRRGRRLECIVNPIMILIFLVVAGVSAAISIRHFDTMSEVSLPADISQDMLRAIVLNDAYRIIAPIIMTAICLFSAFFLFVRLLPTQERKLLLKLTEAMRTKDNQEN